MATTKLQPDYLKSTNTKTNNLQSNLQSNLQTGLTEQFSGLDYKSDFKINTFESKFDSKFNTLESRLDSKFNILEEKLKYNTVELIVELKWQLFFAVSVLIFAISYLLIIYRLWVLRL